MHPIITQFSLTGYINSVKTNCNRIRFIWGVSLAGSTCRVKGVTSGLQAITLRNCSADCDKIWYVFRDQSGMYRTGHSKGASARDHVQIYLRFRIVRTAGRIALKVGVWLEQLAKHFSQTKGGVHLHAHITFPYFGSGRTHCTEIWCMD